MQALQVFATGFFKLRPERRQHRYDIRCPTDHARLGSKNPIGVRTRNEYYGVSVRDAASDEKFEQFKEWGRQAGEERRIRSVILHGAL